LSTYIDSSFLVSLYLTDEHSRGARHRVLSSSVTLFTPLHQAEWSHAVAQHVFRKELSPTEAESVESQLRDDLAAGVWVRADLPENALEVCADLGRRWVPKLGVRTLDTLHVACALQFKVEQFLTFDHRQRQLAKAVGLRTR